MQIGEQECATCRYFKLMLTESQLGFCEHWSSSRCRYVPSASWCRYYKFRLRGDECCLCRYFAKSIQHCMLSGCKVSPRYTCSEFDKKRCEVCVHFRKSEHGVIYAPCALTPRWRRLITPWKNRSYVCSEFKNTNNKYEVVKIDRGYAGGGGGASGAGGSWGGGGGGGIWPPGGGMSGH